MSNTESAISVVFTAFKGLLEKDQELTEVSCRTIKKESKINSKQCYVK